MPRKRGSQTRGETAEKKAKREARRDKVMELVLAGASTREIARQVGVDHSTVANDVKKRLEEQVQNCPNTPKYREIMRLRLNRLIVRWWPLAQTNGAALDRMLKLLDQEARLLGLNKAVNVNVKGEIDHNVNGTITHKPDLTGLSDSDLADLRKLSRKMQVEAGSAGPAAGQELDLGLSGVASEMTFEIPAKDIGQLDGNGDASPAPVPAESPSASGSAPGPESRSDSAGEPSAAAPNPGLATLAPVSRPASNKPAT